MAVISVGFEKRAPADLSKRLRELAGAVDRGEVTDLVCLSIDGGNYHFLWAASLEQSLVMTTLLHATAIDRFRA